LMAPRELCTRPCDPDHKPGVKRTDRTLHPRLPSARSAVPGRGTRMEHCKDSEQAGVMSSCR
jgi:hypothetical protein